MIPDFKKDWFNTWFDSPFYSMLYRERSAEEARDFIYRMTADMRLSSGAQVLDLACGNGRHSKALLDLGFEVTGIDLSATAIALAQAANRGHGLFKVMDMRCFHLEQTMDAVFNLFTSFGYFDSLRDNLNVLAHVRECLKPGGLFVLDYLNADRVITPHPAHYQMEVDGCSFQIEKHTHEGFIVKNIGVVRGTERHEFTERVQLLRLEDFQQMLRESGFDLLRKFGSYTLEPFDPGLSDRLILLCQRL